MKTCKHAKEARAVTARTDGCEECLRAGTRWVHLRICMSCGHVGCCDDSPGKHATAHFHQTQHPVMCSYELEEAWGFCFVDEAMLDAAELPGFRRASGGDHVPV